MNLNNLSDKNTKKELLEGIAELTRKFENLIEGNQSPESLIQMTGKDELKVQAEMIVACPTDVVSILFAKALDNLKEAISTYSDLKDAIKTADEELLDYYGIKREANTLLAILEAKKDAIATLETEKSEKASIWEEKITELAKKFSEESKQLNEKREREEEQYTYDFDRKKKMCEDKLTDELRKKEKEFEQEIEELKKDIEDKEEGLNKREESLEIREEKLESMNTEIKELESYKDKYRDKIIELNSAKKENEHQIALLKSDYENKLLVKDATILMLTGTVEGNNATIDDLSKRLDNAYNNVKEVAANAVNGAVQGNMLNTLRDVATSKEKTSK